MQRLLFFAVTSPEDTMQQCKALFLANPWDVLNTFAVNYYIIHWRYIFQVPESECVEQEFLLKDVFADTQNYWTNFLSMFEIIQLYHIQLD